MMASTALKATASKTTICGLRPVRPAMAGMRTVSAMPVRIAAGRPRPGSAPSILNALSPHRTQSASPADRTSHSSPKGFFKPSGKTADRGTVVTEASSSDFNSLFPSTKNESKPTPAKDTGVGIFWLLVVNFVLFALDNFAGQNWVRFLYLNGRDPQWWQFITCTFCHYDWSHLSQNAFFLYVFGKFVEEEEGAFGVWAVYLLCGIGGAVASYLLGGAAGYSLGASGAVFGLFMVSVLVKLQFNIRKLLEFAILGQFVFKQVMTEVKSQAAVATTSKLGAMVAGGVQVSHIAHLGGAMMGVLLVLLLSRLPEKQD